MKKILMLLIIISLFTGCNNNAEINNINSNIFNEQNQNVNNIVLAEKEDNNKDTEERKYNTECELLLKELIGNDNENILSDMMVYSTNNYDELSFEKLQEMGFNANNYDDFAIALSMPSNKVETYIYLSPKENINTNALFETFKKEFESFYFISDDLKIEFLNKLTKTPYIYKQNNIYRFVISENQDILDKIRKS